MIKNILKTVLDSAFKSVLADIGSADIKGADLNTKELTYTVEHPADISHGDYSSNIAMVYAKQLKLSPRDLAQKILDKVTANLPVEVAGINIAGPGFINFTLTNTFINKSVTDIVKEGSKFGQNEIFKNKKVLIEYTDPNPFKVFHIGHLMSNAIGESISRILEISGAKVERANYQGDVGLHVAKAIWGILQLESEMPSEEKSLSEKVNFISKGYVLGSDKYENDEKAKAEIADLNKKIFEKSDEKVNKIYEWGRKLSLEHFEEIYKKLGTKFNHYLFESNMVEGGMNLVEEGLQKNIFEKSEGAVVFKGENYGLHTRVFINSQGLPTYETKELGLNKFKYDSFKPDLSIIVTANEQSAYFSVLLKVFELLLPDVFKVSKHISHGMLRFASGKMSSRKGNIVTGESLLSDVEEMVEEKIKDRQLTDAEKKNISDKVSVGAIKYSILKQSTGSDIIYDFEKSISFEGDSGPYLQYACVRANAVLAKAGDMEPKVISAFPAEISKLEKMLYRFPEVVEHSMQDLEPHYISTYLTELAGEFNSYYAKNQILNEKDPATPYRLALTKAFAIVMNSGLNLLGISVPERM